MTNPHRVAFLVRTNKYIQYLYADIQSLPNLEIACLPIFQFLNQCIATNQYCPQKAVIRKALSLSLHRNQYY